MLRPPADASGASDPFGGSRDRAPAQPDRSPPAWRYEPPAGEPTDHELLKRAQRGEEDAFAMLVRRHQARAARIARNLVPGDEDAQDLVQEAFLRVFRSLDRFDFEHDFTTWLYRIVTNLSIDYLRRRRPTVSTAGGGPGSDFEPESEFDIADADAPAPDRALDARETKAKVRACIDALAPHFQAVLILRELEGLPCTEIARIVGATHVTVRWRLHRGRKLFQEEWERRERLAARAPELAERQAEDEGPVDESAEETRGSSTGERDRIERGHERSGRAPDADERDTTE
jgi:RNA polymerase sigma-70 factor (ECF subfamily)